MHMCVGIDLAENPKHKVIWFMDLTCRKNHLLAPPSRLRRQILFADQN